MGDESSDEDNFINIHKKKIEQHYAKTISSSSDDKDDIEDEESEHSCGHQLSTFKRRLFRLSYKHELLALLKIQIPACLTAFFQFFLQTVSIIMSGHLSTEEMDAVALACSIVNVGGICIGAGLSSACDTFFSQTFGSSNKKRVGIYLQRSLIAMYMALLIVYCIYLNIRIILPFLGQDLVVSEMTAEYLFVFMPGLFFDYTFMVISRYLQIQNFLYSPLVCAFLANILNVIMQYVSIKIYGARYLATAVCQVLSMGFMCVSLIIYVIISKVYKDTWGGWSREAFYDIWKFMKIGLPGILLFMLEMGSFEVGIFVMGTVNTVQLGAQAIIMNCATLAYMPCIGLSTAVAIRVGKKIGGGNIAGAKHSYKVALSITFAVAVFLTIFFACLTHEIPKWFSNDPDVIAVTANGLRAYTVFPFVDGVSATTVGVLKGCGRQLLGATGNFIAYVVIALPVGIPLALLTDLQVSGIWIGLFIGVFIECVILLLFIARLDWYKEIRLASKRFQGREILEEEDEDDDEEEDSEEDKKNKKDNQSLKKENRELEKNPEGINVELSIPLAIEAELPPFKPVLIRRLINFGIILLLLAASIFSFLIQTPLVDLSNLCHQVNNTHLKHNSTFCAHRMLLGVKE